MKIKLFTYWEGYKPDYIKLCEKIISKQICSDIEYHPINDINLYDYLSENELPINLKYIYCLAHKADYIRCCLIYKYGGIWLDSDQILLSNLSNIVDLLKSYDYVTYEWEKDCPSISFFASHKNDLFLSRWKSGMENLITTKNQFNWTELGYDLMWPILHNMFSNKEIKYYAFDARKGFAPLEWCEYELFFDTKYQINLKDVQSIHLFNEKLPKWFKNMSQDEILRNDYLISKLFKLVL